MWGADEAARPCLQLGNFSVFLSSLPAGLTDLADFCKLMRDLLAAGLSHCDTEW